MRLISDNIRTRTAIPNNTTAVGFVNSTSLPVWRMLSVGNTIPGSGLADTLIGNYKEVIAADYAFAFLSQFTNVALSALQKQYRLNPCTADTGASPPRGRPQVPVAATSRADGDVLEGESPSPSVATDLERLERNLRANMSAHVLDMLGYANRGIQ